MKVDKAKNDKEDPAKLHIDNYDQLFETIPAKRDLVSTLMVHKDLNSMKQIVMLFQEYNPLPSSNRIFMKEILEVLFFAT